MGDLTPGLPSAFVTSTNSSFVQLLAQFAPQALPINRVGESAAALEAPHGTTVLALTFEGGVLMAGDRRATMGNYIAQRDLEKVQFADEYSAIAFAGTVGLAKDLVRLFQFELEHYEKIEGRRLSLQGKARRLAPIVQSNLPQALQGLAVIPLYAGYDLEKDVGRVFSFDVTGGPYETTDFYADGSGSPYARGSLKKLYRPGMHQEDAVLAAVQALYDAADDDSATGGPDLGRRIYPTIAIVTADGYRRLPDEELAGVVESVVAGRQESPGGPIAPLR